VLPLLADFVFRAPGPWLLVAALALAGLVIAEAIVLTGTAICIAIADAVTSAEKSSRRLAAGGRGRGALIVALAAGGVLPAAGWVSVAPPQNSAAPGGGVRPQDAHERYRPPTPRGMDEYYPVPESNELTAAKAELGRRLFFDRRLSIDRSIACASCHRPDRAFSDTVALSSGIGGRHTLRNTPSILNRAYGRIFFRDGRTPTLEATVLRPITNPNEMGLDLSEAMSRLRADSTYVAFFGEAFEGGLTRLNLARALASYVRTLRSGDSPFDRYMSGDREALSEEAKAGFRLFAGKAGCVACHLPPIFSDEKLHNTGVFVESGDPGRYNITGTDADRGAFKTPTLRNLSLTAPYMHDGSLATLEEVIEFYDRGGNANPNLDREVRPLRLTEEEKWQLLAFLRALTGSHLPAGVSRSGPG